MTAQPPSYDPQNFRSDAVPSDTQAIYIQEGGDSASNLLICLLNILKFFVYKKL